MIDGREAGFGVVEGQDLPVQGPHRPPRAPFSPGSGLWCGACCELRSEARLCGHVGERVGGTVGQDVRLGHLQDGNAGGHFVQAAADHGFLNIQHALVKSRDSLENSNGASLLIMRHFAIRWILPRTK